MAIAVRAYGETDFTTATASPAVNKPTSPSSIQDGDVMLMWLVTNTTTTVASGPISGWTRIAAGDFASDGTATLWYKVHSGDGSSWTMTNIFGSSSRCDVVVIAYSGCDQYNPIHKSAGITSTSSNAISGPSVTPTLNNCMIVQFGGTDPGSGTYTGTPDTSPVGTERWDAKNTGGSNYEYIIIQEYLQTSNGSIALDYTSLTSDDYGHAQVALAPAGTALTIADAYCISYVETFAVTQNVVNNLTVADASCISFVEVFKTTKNANLIGLTDASCISFVEVFKTTKNANLIGLNDAYCISQVDATSVIKNLIVADAYSTSQVDTFSVTVPSAAKDLVLEDAYCISQSDAIAYFPQILFPASDMTDGNWTNESGNNINLYESVNETSASDSDYIQSEYNPATSPCVIGLNTGIDPASSSGHILKYRLEKYPVGGETLSFVIQLRQSYVNESNQGTLIAEWTDSDLSSTMATVERTLSAGEADSITNYASLFIRMVAD